MIYNMLNRSAARFAARHHSVPFVSGFNRLLVAAGDFDRDTVVNLSVVTGNVEGHERAFVVVMPVDGDINYKVRDGYLYGYKSAIGDAGQVVAGSDNQVLIRVRAGFRFVEKESETVLAWDGHQWRVSDLVKAQAEDALAKANSGNTIASEAGINIPAGSWYYGPVSGSWGWVK